MGIETQALVVSDRTITTDGLLNYLWNDPYLVGPEMSLARTLRLDFATPAFRELFEQSRDVYVNSEQERQSIEKTLNRDAEKSDGLTTQSRAAMQRLGEGMRRLGDIRGAGERSRVIYIDHNDFGIYATEPVFGEYRKTHMQIDTVVDRDDIPLLEVHTHPSNTLPSPVDYSSILTRLYTDDDIRYVNGFAVLCPSIQILALKTPQTPIFNPEQTEEFVKGQMDLTRAERYRAIGLKGAYTKALKQGVQDLVKCHAHAVETTAETEGYYLKGLLAEEEFERLAAEQIALALKKGTEIGEKNQIRQAKTIDRLFGYGRFVTNQKLLEFARKINVSLYASTDFMHFTQFAA